MSKILITIESSQLDEKALEELAIAVIPTSSDWKECYFQMTGAKPADIVISYPSQVDNKEQEELSEEELEEQEAENSLIEEEMNQEEEDKGE